MLFMAEMQDYLRGRVIAWEEYAKREGLPMHPHRTEGSSNYFRAAFEAGYDVAAGREQES